ncbi:MAG: ribosome biogenesis GTP-binding protein YihA/YsxC [Bacteroidales bacterium]
MMVIRSAEFVKSSPSYKDCPRAPFPEYAFLGRSNVGKSSLINMLTSHGKLAKISSTPGKTRLINHFLINNKWYLADLPGYGFAKVSKSEKMTWEKTIRDYMFYRENLLCSFILIDIRHDLQKNDREFLTWVGTNELPFCILFTKADKLSGSKIPQQLSRFRQALSEQWEPLPPMIVSSSQTGKGREEILKLIDDCNNDFFAR